RSVVAPVARWLTMLAGPDRSRAVITRTLKGSLSALPAWVTGVSDAVEEQVEAAAVLRTAAERAVPPVRDAARAAVLDGAVARGSREARWAQVTGAGRVDRVTVRGGVVRSSKRRGRAREQVLAPLLEETREAARRTLAADGVLGHEALRAALDGERPLPGASDVLPAEEDAAARREASATTQVLQWSRRAEQVVAELAAPTAADAARAAVKAFGETGLAALLLAGAAGNDDAARLVRTVLAATGEDALAALRDDLAERAATMVEREVEPVLTALDDPALAADAAVGLRLRPAELRSVMCGRTTPSCAPGPTTSRARWTSGATASTTWSGRRCATRSPACASASRSASTTRSSRSRAARARESRACSTGCRASTSRTSGS